MQKKAIDISYCQQNIDFTAVKLSGVEAVIIRNGYLGKTDTEWDRHVTGVLNAGLDVGTYTYIMSENVAQARTEAKETIKRLEKYKGKITYPIFADMESDKYLNGKFTTAQRTAILLSFLETIQKADYCAGIYTNPAWIKNYLDQSKIMGKYYLWLAAWTDNPNKATKYQLGQSMWQWGTGKVNGIKGDVDCDLVYVDFPAWLSKFDFNFLPKTKTVTLDFQAAIRSAPSASSKKLGVLNPGTIVTIIEESDTVDPATKYTYVRLYVKGIEKTQQWIVKSALKK